MTATKQAPVKVDHITDGGYLIRGVAADDTPGLFAAAERGRRAHLLAGELGSWYEQHPDELAEDSTVQSLRIIRTGLFRKTPCNPSSCFDGGGHAWHLNEATIRKAGAFEAVYVE